MGSILTNGVFLPAEGERNCYEGLAANWTALDRLIGGYNAHIGNATIHVTAADKQAWNGKADASALTAHTGDTTIHVTAEDKNKWNGKADASALTAHTGDTTIHVTAADKQAWNGKADASALTAHTGDTTIHVTSADKQAWNGKQDALSQTQLDAVNSGIDSTKVQQIATNTSDISSLQSGKANDSEVVHKSGNETINGNKTFSENVNIYNSNTSVGPRYLVLRNQKVKRGSTTEVGTQFITFQDKDGGTLASYEANVSSSGNTQAYINVSNVDANSQRVIGGVKVIKTPTETWFIPDGDNTVSSGLSNYKWKDVNTKLINGLEPSSLSLPNLSAGIDIRGYITNLNKGVNTYTPPANGWLSIRVKKTSLTHTSLMMYQTGGLPSSCETTEFSISGTNLPVIANQNVEIYIYADALVEAKFYPCQGNL